MGSHHGPPVRAPFTSLGPLVKERQKLKARGASRGSTAAAPPALLLESSEHQQLRVLEALVEHLLPASQVHSRQDTD